MRDHKRRTALVERHGEGTLWFEAPRIDDRVVGQDLLHQLVDRLDARAAEVFALHFLDGLDQAEVARVMGRSSGATRVLLHRALARLASLLDEDDEA